MQLTNGVDLKWTGTYGDHAKYQLIVGDRVLLAIAVDETDMTIRYGKPNAEIADMVTSSRLAQRKQASVVDEKLVLGRISMTSVASAIMDAGLLFRLAKVYGMEVDA